jgi:hypothetical protein
MKFYTAIGNKNGKLECVVRTKGRDARNACAVLASGHLGEGDATLEKFVEASIDGTPYNDKDTYEAAVRKAIRHANHTDFYLKTSRGEYRTALDTQNVDLKVYLVQDPEHPGVVTMSEKVRDNLTIQYAGMKKRAVVSETTF